jgi:glycosyltransferase involved in cell wall biosynthesis
MLVSVIVCTRNRADSIGDTFEALAQLSPAATEILVIDSSTEPERQKTESLARKFGARYVFEPRSGLSLARNTGLTLATQEIIAFTDDDCIPEKDWLAHKMECLAEPDVWACTGRVFQHNSEGACDLFEEVAGQNLGSEKRSFSRSDLDFGIGKFLSNAGKVFLKHMKSKAPVPWCLGHGSTMAFRKEVFEKIGLFDERLGAGAPLKACDDTEMFYRILKSNHKIVYNPAAVVRHKHGLTEEEVFKTRYACSFGGSAFMWENRRDTLMFVMFWGRLVQLLLKTTQYKLFGRRELAKSFSSDLRGFIQGWSLYRKFSKENPGSNHRLLTPAQPQSPVG